MPRPSVLFIKCFDCRNPGTDPEEANLPFDKDWLFSLCGGTVRVPPDTWKLKNDLHIEAVSKGLPPPRKGSKVVEVAAAAEVPKAKKRKPVEKGFKMMVKKSKSGNVSYSDTGKQVEGQSLNIFNQAITEVGRPSEKMESAQKNGNTPGASLMSGQSSYLQQRSPQYQQYRPDQQRPAHQQISSQHYQQRLPSQQQHQAQQYMQYPSQHQRPVQQYMQHPPQHRPSYHPFQQEYYQHPSQNPGKLFEPSQNPEGRMYPNQMYQRPYQNQPQFYAGGSINDQNFSHHQHYQPNPNLINDPNRARDISE